jgi:hypothetical protein
LKNRSIVFPFSSVAILGFVNDPTTGHPPLEMSVATVCTCSVAQFTVGVICRQLVEVLACISFLPHSTMS